MSGLETFTLSGSDEPEAVGEKIDADSLFNLPEGGGEDDEDES